MAFLNTPTIADHLRQAAKQIDEKASSGEIVTVDPEVADFMASFDEAALAEAEAIASALHVEAVTGVVILNEEEETWQ